MSDLEQRRWIYTASDSPVWCRWSSYHSQVAQRCVEYSLYLCLGRRWDLSHRRQARRALILRRDIYHTVIQLRGADLHGHSSPGRVYIAKTVAGIAIGWGAASRVDYPDGPGHRGGSCNSTASSRGMDLPPAGRYCSWRVIVYL